MAIDTNIREAVPFRVRTADGDTVELTYSSPRPAATHDEPATRERDEVLDPPVGADRGDRRLDVVDADAVVLEHLVVAVELRLEAPEVGGAGGARVVVLPLGCVLRPRLVLGRPGHEDLA